MLTPEQVNDEINAAAERFIAETSIGISIPGNLKLPVEEIMRRTYRIAYADGLHRGIRLSQEVLQSNPIQVNPTKGS